FRKDNIYKLLTFLSLHCKKEILGRISLCIAGILLATAIPGLSQEGPSSFEFVENKGQWDQAVEFRGEIGSGAFYIQKNGFTVTLYHPDDMDVLIGHDHHSKQNRGGKGRKKIDYTRDMSGVVIDRSIAPEERILRAHAY